VPVRFVFVAELPKTPGVGKIDRIALRARIDDGNRGAHALTRR
jgi:acyl-coenzyme A synthetase/AMP-(fatty) acid ligase